MLIPSLFTCLAGGVMEEFFFRGYGYFRIRQWGLSPLGALVLINILFAGGHLYEGYPTALFALISGFYLSLLVIRGVSLFSLAAAHGIFNFILILLNYLGQAELL